MAATVTVDAIGADEDDALEVDTDSEAEAEMAVAADAWLRLMANHRRPAASARWQRKGV